MDLYRLLPSYWHQNYPTSIEWDQALNDALDSHVVEPLDHYTAQVGPFEVWTENYPYAFGNLHDPLMKRVLPRVATRKRLRAAIANAANRDFSAHLAMLKAREGGQS